MSMRNLNVLRQMRIKLKNGWLKEVPPEYYFMVRYPPMGVSVETRKKKMHDIPYAKYIRKAMQRSPKFSGEGVFPAYWQDEPMVLIFAKKQYELIQKGMSEEEAYQQAEKEVYQLEANAYDEAAAVQKLIHEKGANSVIVSDESVVKEIQKWKAMLSKRPFDSLDLADQGEIDYFLQTKVLKWNEVERERRMTDPIFAMQFDKLREEFFPEIATEKRRVFENSRESFKNQQLVLLGIQNFSQLQAAQPFFYSDYVEYFNRLKEQPYLGRWSEKNREKLSRWIVDTLAMKAKLEGHSRLEMQKYLDTIRSQYFPMVKHPTRASEFNLPSEAELREILYKNDIGYKKQDGKLFVLRCYRLPLLLFPRETLLTSLTADESKLQVALSDEGYLKQTITDAGLDQATLPEIQADLQEYQRTYSSYGSQVAASASTGSGIDLSVLDQLLKDDSTPEPPQPADSAASAATETSIVGEAETALAIEAVDVERVMTLREKYGLMPKTAYDVAKNSHLEQFEAFSWTGAKTEDDFDVIAANRLEREYVLRARCQLRYEQKEAARRVRDWKRRDVVDPKEIAVRSMQLNIGGKRSRL